MMYLHSEKVLKMRSNRQNRFRYDLFRVLTSSYQSVNMPVFSAIFNGFGHHMSEHQLSPATIWKFQIVRCAKRSLPKPKASSIRVAEYLTELPPREVLEKKPEGSGCDAQRAARRYAGGEMKETVPKGMWRMAGVGA